MKTKIPPPVICLICMTIMYCLPSILAFPKATWLVVMLVGLSGIIGIASVILFRLAKTTISPLHPNQTSHIVQTGIYRFSRNPMYLSIAIFLVAFAIYLENATALLVIPLFIWSINYLQIHPEEQMLEQKFGEEYLAYKKAVRRWV
ncbi:isoprenylcysteine carboxylmethyltransferase family protein [Haemophilus paraphrohaemolyticus]|uniref:Isoprenylcysteine carboxylmethyltransferase family protein n=1 Tax=Haemophilus paraphrohaemolyticus TaxID=736 RepID=A0A369ZRG4_9PAST|nr:isoprenylcysteine carboxylmethyltransferase family protein [Haemophilus paraphrohaemolyticus]RDF10179.1 isoprenylcysteine carboxylmethyltransferase family protein [Haemophilus paraphrohaemolyticus]